MVFVIVVLGGSAVLFVIATLFSAERRFKRQLAATPRTPIGQASTGTIKISGQLGYVSPPLQAPPSAAA